MSNTSPSEADARTLFELPSHMAEASQLCHAGAIIIGTRGILLRGGSGSGKSVLQRYLRSRAQQQGLYAALISDDYVRIAVTSPTHSDARIHVMAFAAKATEHLQEVRGVGIVPISDPHHPNRAVIDLIVDLVEDADIVRMPEEEDAIDPSLGPTLPRLAVPIRSSVIAADMVFARLSTWKSGT